MGMELVFCDCNSNQIDQFPALTLVIEGIDYVIPSSTYVSVVQDINVFQNSNTCILAVSY